MPGVRKYSVLQAIAAALLYAPGQRPDLGKTPPLGIAFQPRGFHELPVLRYPSTDQVRQDLKLIRRAGFRSLVTYGADDVLRRVPELARAEGFDGMIVMGIWNPLSREELENAVSQSGFVDGYCVGNEGLGVRYRPDELAPKMAEIRKRTGKPVTTSERLPRYIEGPDAKWLVDNSDWLFPIAHPYLALHRGGMTAVEWVVARYDYLAASSDKTVILKEVGFPTGGAALCNEDTQLDFFKKLSNTGITFFFFEAFDQPHKRGRGDQPEIEHHWGLYRADGTPKKVVAWLAGGGRGRE